MAYVDAWDMQMRLHAERVRDERSDTLLVLEHLPVYTFGRTAKPAHWGGDRRALREQGADLQSVNRGGSVTYHGPGQVVVYPILRLARYAAGPRDFVRLLEEVILDVLEASHIHGHRVSGKPGVWVASPEEGKIASIGVRVEQGVTLHGFALNVDLDLAPFERILPCGLAGCRVTSMARVRETSLAVGPVMEDIVNAFARVLSVRWSRHECDAGFRSASSDARTTSFLS